jgi:hypothetical protein
LSQAGVLVRHQIPILTHWKHYKKPSSVVLYRNFVDRLTVCMGILSWHSTLLWATLTNLLFIHTTTCSQGWTLTRLTHQHKKLARMYCSLGYGRLAIGWSKPTSMASLLIRSLRPLLSCPWPMHNGVNLMILGLVLRTRCVCEPINFLSSLAMVYLCCSLTQMKL